MRYMVQFNGPVHPTQDLLNDIYIAESAPYHSVQNLARYILQKNLHLDSQPYLPQKTITERKTAQDLNSF